jgi:hypothetical protein
MTEGAIVPLGRARSASYLGSAGSTPIMLKMDPAVDAGMIRCVQRVGAAVGRFTIFCPRLEPDRLAFQSLGMPESSAA